MLLRTCCPKNHAFFYVNQVSSSSNFIVNHDLTNYILREIHLKY
uniref:Uncharacterized protein n=1 Tax=Rhizophora mucronata TaxID=61149 RepID=A0A2P2R4I3_RHIMU